LRRFMACCPRGEKEREPNGLPCFAHSRRSQFREQQASVEHLCENVKAAASLGDRNNRRPSQPLARNFPSTAGWFASGAARPIRPGVYALLLRLARSHLSCLATTLSHDRHPCRARRVTWSVPLAFPAILDRRAGSVLVRGAPRDRTTWDHH
jgi:hypothetical protein